MNKQEARVEITEENEKIRFVAGRYEKKMQIISISRWGCDRQLGHMKLGVAV